MAKASKNEENWRQVFSDCDVLNNIKSQGYFDISAQKINKYRESRLMAKMDNHSQVPAIFSENRLGILPLSRGSYRIAPFAQMKKLPEAPVKNQKSILYPAHIESLRPNDITSEANLINACLLSGVFQKALGVEKVYQTISGRMGSGRFDFHCLNTNNNPIQFQVENAQIEIDVALETRDAFYVIESKMSRPNEFHVRQLYYPYRTWRERLQKKKVVPLLLSKYKDSIILDYFHFQELQNYNSCQWVASQAFRFTDDQVSLDDIVKLNATIPIKTETEAPFPQADSLDRVIDMISLFGSENPNKENEALWTVEDIVLEYDFDPRQADYYSNALLYLGLAQRSQAKSFSLSEKGQRMLQINSKRNFYLELIKEILSHRPFKETFQESLTTSIEDISKEWGMAMMKSCRLKNITSASTLGRRFQTVKAWIKWIREKATQN